MNITVANNELKWTSKDGQKRIFAVLTTTGKKYKDDTGLFETGQSYDVLMEERDGKFGKEYWIRMGGGQSSSAAPAAAAQVASATPPASKNAAFALSYAKDIMCSMFANVPGLAEKTDPVASVLSIAEDYRKYLDGERTDDLPY